VSDTPDNVRPLPGVTPAGEVVTDQERRANCIESLREFANRLEAGENVQVAGILRRTGGFEVVFSSPSAATGIALARVLEKAALDRYLGLA
jgi:hypothetical protein